MVCDNALVSNLLKLIFSTQKIHRTRIKT